MESKYVTEITQRYIYDVTRRLPENQRADIERELHTLIEDMLAERDGNGSSTNADINAVLTELGKPSELADKYRGEKRYLISGEFYEKYLLILKIVLPCVAFGTAIAGVIAFLTAANSQPLQSITTTSSILFTQNLISSVFSNIVSTLLSSFAALTIAFAIVERQFKHHEHRNRIWNVNDLPQIPDRKVTIRSHQVIVDIAFTVLFAIVFAAFPQIFSVWTYVGTEGTKIIPIFNLSIWPQILPFFLGWSALRLVRDGVKLAVGKFDIKVVMTSLVVDILSVILVFVFTSSLTIWNGAFVQELQQVTTSQTPVTAQLLNNVLLAIALISAFIDGLFTIIRSFRYGRHM